MQYCFLALLLLSRVVFQHGRILGCTEFVEAIGFLLALSERLSASPLLIALLLHIAPSVAPGLGCMLAS